MFRHAIIFLLVFAAADLVAQKDNFKAAGPRAPNPVVNRPATTAAKPKAAKSRRNTARAPRLSIAEQIEDAIDRGNTARDADQLDVAEKQYRRAISLNQNEWRAWYGLGNVYNDGGSYDQAISALLEAIRLNIDSAEAHHSLGTSYFLKGHYSDAIYEYQTAVRLKPDYAYAYYDLAMAYMKMNDKDGAMRQYEILKRLNPGLAANLRSYIR
jgi:tetratricopeptide (TPR) repeat protein